MEDYQEALEYQEEVSRVLTQQGFAEDDEDLLKELDELDMAEIPEVPRHSLPNVEIPEPPRHSLPNVELPNAPTKQPGAEKKRVLIEN